MGGTEQDLVEMVALAYEAAAEPARWPAFLARVSGVAADRGCTLMVQDLRRAEGSFAFTHGIEPAAAAAYATRFAAINPWTTRGADAMRPGEVLVSEAALPVAELRRTEFCADFLRPHDILHSTVAVIERDGDAVAYLSWQSSARRGPASTADLALIDALTPFLRRAFALHRRLGAHRDQQQALTDTADRLPWGVLFLDERRRVVFANTAARRLDRATTARVLAAGDAGGGLVVRDDRPALAVSVSPLRIAPDPTLPGQPTRAVFIVDPDAQPTTSEALLRRSYALTGAEARLACALARGESLHEIADATAVTVATLRTHLKRVFDKTGTRRQAELVRLLLLLASVE